MPHDVHYQMGSKQLTSLSVFILHLQSPPLIYALSLVHHVPIYNKILKFLQKYVGILPALHPHAPK